MAVPIDWIRSSLGTPVWQGTCNVLAELPGTGRVPEHGGRVESTLLYLDEGYSRLDVPTTALRCEAVDGNGFAPVLTLLELPASKLQCLPMYLRDSVLWALKPLDEAWGTHPIFPSNGELRIDQRRLTRIPRQGGTSHASLGEIPPMLVNNQDSLDRFLGLVEELKSTIRRAIWDIRK